MTDFVTVTTSVDDLSKAETLARGAVEARLAACAQVSDPVSSVYWWNGAVDSAREHVVTFKTTQAHGSALVEYIKKAHPYDVPEVLVAPVLSGNDAYLAWVAAETATAQPT
ncbi:MAG TPA: divalent-cation tolerance protein CutA [Streptosporangiaceae bacterium]|nr:divalent-cation tolerance protein CutA [Streptosporangiaceae bacterium]